MMTHHLEIIKICFLFNDEFSFMNLVQYVNALFVKHLESRFLIQFFFLKKTIEKIACIKKVC